MALMRAAAGANDLGSHHAVSCVANLAKMPVRQGAVKLGQPVPLSNFVPALNNGSPHNRQL